MKIGKLVQSSVAVLCCAALLLCIFSLKTGSPDMDTLEQKPASAMLISAPDCAISSTAAATIRCVASSSSTGGRPPHPRLRATICFLGYHDLQQEPDGNTAHVRTPGPSARRGAFRIGAGIPIIQMSALMYGHAEPRPRHPGPHPSGLPGPA